MKTLIYVDRINAITYRIEMSYKKDGLIELMSKKGGLVSVMFPP